MTTRRTHRHASGRTFLRPLLVLIAVAAVALGLYHYLEPAPIVVAVRAVERGTVEGTVANTRAGTVKACRRSKLAPQTGGEVERLPVKRGDHVKANAILMELWNDDLRAQLQLAESQARADTARAEQGCLAADLAAREADRMTQLFTKHVADEQSRDRAESDRETTRAACVAARASADESRSRINVAKAALERTILRAPFDGVVAEVNGEVGEVVIPSPPGIPTPPAIDLIEEGCLYVSAPIDEVDARRVTPGLPARVTLDAYPGKTLDGKVRRVAPYVLDVEKQARTREVEVNILDPRAFPDVVPGYSADVEVILDRRDDVLRVPAEAISGEGRVLVLASGRLEERAIATGVTNWQYAEVTTGLKEGDLVVVSHDRTGVVAGALAVAEHGAGG
jgi:HlyD family secretion protein